MAQNYFCKWCGYPSPHVGTLTGNQCLKSPIKGGHHELYEGSEKSQYICKFCGTTSTSISGLTANRCIRHPNKGFHEPAL